MDNSAKRALARFTGMLLGGGPPVSAGALAAPAFEIAPGLAVTEVQTEAGPQLEFLTFENEGWAPLPVLDGPRRDLARAALTPIFHDLLAHPHAASKGGAARLFGLSAPTRQALLDLVDIGAVVTTIRQADQAGEMLLRASADPEEPPVSLDARGFVGLFRYDHAETLKRAVRTGDYVLPSISTPGATDRALCISFSRADGYIQCVDGATGVPYGLRFSYQQGTVVDWIYLPRDGLVLFPRAKRPAQRAAVVRTLTEALAYMLAADHLAAWAAPDRDLTLGFCMWPAQRSHIGHRIWNEFSGLHELIRENPTRPITVYDLAAADGVEHYGPVSEIFPEVARVDREAKDMRAAFAAAARDGVLVLPYSGNYVYRAVRERITAAVAADRSRPVQIQRRHAARLSVEGAEGCTMIVLGLRVHDRTAENLQELYIDLLRRLCEVSNRKVVAVFDGMNAAGGVAGKVFSVGTDANSVLAKELAFCEVLTNAFAGDDRIEFVNCVGMSLRENLTWLASADFFIAPMGGGLAKYRWVVNLPGVALTSNMNRRFAAWLNIYDDPKEMELPELLVLNPETLTEDILPADMRFDEAGRSLEPWRGGLSALNFRVDAPRMVDLIVDRFSAVVH